MANNSTLFNSQTRGSGGQLRAQIKEFKEVLEYMGRSRDPAFLVQYQERAGQILEQEILQVVRSRDETNFLLKERAASSAARGGRRRRGGGERERGIESVWAVTRAHRSATARVRAVL